MAGIDDVFKKEITGKRAPIGCSNEPQPAFYFFPCFNARNAPAQVNRIDHIACAINIKLTPGDDLLADPDIPRAPDIINIRR